MASIEKRNTADVIVTDKQNDVTVGLMMVAGLYYQSAGKGVALLYHSLPLRTLESFVYWHPIVYNQPLIEPALMFVPKNLCLNGARIIKIKNSGCQ